jgi:hypothetical protein
MPHVSLDGAGKKNGRRFVTLTYRDTDPDLRVLDLTGLSGAGGLAWRMRRKLWTMVAHGCHTAPPARRARGHRPIHCRGPTMDARDMSRLSGRNPEPVSAIELLCADHGRPRDLFDAFEEASRTPRLRRWRSWPGRSVASFLIHNQIEQEVLSPAAGQISE